MLLIQPTAEQCFSCTSHEGSTQTSSIFHIQMGTLAIASTGEINGGGLFLLKGNIHCLIYRDCVPIDSARHAQKSFRSRVSLYRSSQIFWSYWSPPGKELGELFIGSPCSQFSYFGLAVSYSACRSIAYSSLDQAVRENNYNQGHRSLWIYVLTKIWIVKAFFLEKYFAWLWGQSKDSSSRVSVGVKYL